MIALNRIATSSLLCLAAATAIAAAPPLLNDPVDVSGDFRALENSYYLVDRVAEFDPAVGTWIDYQSGKDYSGGWQKIVAGKIPEIILVRDGSVIPQIALAQSTALMDWSKIELHVFAKAATTAKGLIFLPGDRELHTLTAANDGNSFQLVSDPFAGKVSWKISIP